MRASPSRSGFLLRDDDEKHHEFRSALQQRWGRIWRIRMGRERGSAASIKWCSENLEAEYARSDGCEVYYFADEQDSIMFKLRWS